MHFDLARHQVALVRLVAQNRSQPVQFIKDTIQLVKWVDNSLAVRAKGNLDKLIKLLQILILNFNLNSIKIKQLNQIQSDHTGKLFKIHRKRAKNIHYEMRRRQEYLTNHTIVPDFLRFRS